MPITKTYKKYAPLAVEEEDGKHLTEDFLQKNELYQVQTIILPKDEYVLLSSSNFLLKINPNKKCFTRKGNPVFFNFGHSPQQLPNLPIEFEALIPSNVWTIHEKDNWAGGVYIKSIEEDCELRFQLLQNTSY